MAGFKGRQWAKSSDVDGAWVVDVELTDGREAENSAALKAQSSASWNEAED